jgi:hypothetical protein
MKRHELEHILRAASAVTNHSDIVVIGSQALLGQFPDAPAQLLVSMEADVYPKGRADLSIQIDGAIGERSLFHETFGYYAHGVDETTATLPGGWQERLVPIRNENTGGATGWCLEAHDLAVSKLVAGREKDLEFVRGLLKHRLADPKRIEALFETLPTSADVRELSRSRLGRLTSSAA